MMRPLACHAGTVRARTLACVGAAIAAMAVRGAGANVLLGASGVVSPLASGQQQTPVFRAGVDAVQLDVTVVGKDRLPIHGLTAGDFTIREDGKVRQIVALQEVRIEGAPQWPTAWMRDVPPDVTSNDQDTTRLVVIVIDDALIPLDPFIVENTKTAVRTIVDALGPGDLAAVVFTADNRRAQDFTRDRAALLETLDQLMPGFATWKFGTDVGGRANTDDHFFWSSVKTVRSIAEQLGVVTNRRKLVFWVTPGVPLGQPLSAAVAGFPATSRATVSAPPDPDPNVPAPGPTVADARREMIRQARLGDVVICPIDPTGLGGLAEYIRGETYPTLRGDADGVGRKEARLSLDFLVQTAADTGGHAIVNTNDVRPGIATVLDENSAYYLLGYASVGRKDDGTLRRVEVTVDRPGVTVQTRSYTQAPKAALAAGGVAGGADAADAGPSPALLSATAGLVPATGLPMSVALAPFALAGSRTAAVAVVVNLDASALSGASGTGGRDTVDLQISAFTPEGAARGSTRSTAAVVVKPGPDGRSPFGLLARIDLAPGRYAVRLAAHSASTGRRAACSRISSCRTSRRRRCPSPAWSSIARRAH